MKLLLLAVLGIAASMASATDSMFVVLQGFSIGLLWACVSGLATVLVMAIVFWVGDRR